MSPLPGTLTDPHTPQPAPCAAEHLFRLVVVGEGQNRKVLLFHGYEAIPVAVEAFLAFVDNGQEIYQQLRATMPHAVVPEGGAFGFIRFFGPEGNLKVLVAERTLDPGNYQEVGDYIGNRDILTLDHDEFWMLLSRGRELYEEADRCSPRAVVIPSTQEV